MIGCLDRQYTQGGVIQPKALAEHYIIAKAKEKKLDYIIFRLFNVYGSNLKGRVVDNFIEKALKNQNLQINGNGSKLDVFYILKIAWILFLKFFQKKYL